MDGQFRPPARPEKAVQVAGLIALLAAAVAIMAEQVLAADPAMADDTLLHQVTYLAVVDGPRRRVPEVDPRIARRLEETRVHGIVAELHDRAQDASRPQQPRRLAFEAECFIGVETIDERIAE